MPAKDLYHDCTRNALIKDGWTITHDPYVLTWGVKDLYVDLGAERLLAADKENQKIAVEVKSFVSPSEIGDLEVALGQFTLYKSLLNRTEPDRQLLLSIPDSVYFNLFEEAKSVGKVLLEDQQLKLLTFDIETEVIVRWIC